MSPLERLSRLMALRDSGALSQAEFEAEKAKLGIGKVDTRGTAGRKRPRETLMHFITVVGVAAAILVLTLMTGMLGVSVDDQQVETDQNATEVTDASIRPRRVDDAASTHSLANQQQAATDASVRSASEPGRCELTIGTTTIIDGDCAIWREPSGFVQIAKQASGSGHFVQIIPDENGPLGFWNRDPTLPNAFDALGQLSRKGSCWRNDDAKICVWSKRGE